MSNYELRTVNALAADTTHIQRLNDPAVVDFLDEVSARQNGLTEQKNSLRADVIKAAVDGFRFYAGLSAIFGQDDAAVQEQLPTSDLADLLGSEADQGWQVMHAIGLPVMDDHGNKRSNVVGRRDESERTEDGLSISALAQYTYVGAAHTRTPYVKVRLSKAETELLYTADMDGEGQYKQVIQRWRLNWRRAGAHHRSIALASMRQYYLGTGDTIRFAAQERVIEANGTVATQAMYRSIQPARGYTGGSQILSEEHQHVIDHMLKAG